MVSASTGMSTFFCQSMNAKNLTVSNTEGILDCDSDIGEIE
jgi:hypothetical protein